jgi:hypothetical protein
MEFCFLGFFEREIESSPMKRHPGFSVRIFIPSGEPEGLRIVEKSNWTGQGMVIPRSLFPDVRSRPELKRTGVYLLMSPEEQASLPKLYVGEGDVVLSRLDQHLKNKDFWTQAVVFTSKDQYLNKAHVRYLEAKLVSLAEEAKRCELENGTQPQDPSLSEADVADAEGFLEDILLCLPVVGVRFFEKPRVKGKKAKRLFLKARGIQAIGFDEPEGFIVLAGSQANKKPTPSLHEHLRALRETLAKNGVFAEVGEGWELRQDYSFSSPSMAASVMTGRNSNGRIVWKDEQGRTLKEIQEMRATNKGETNGIWNH